MNEEGRLLGIEQQIVLGDSDQEPRYKRGVIQGIRQGLEKCFSSHIKCLEK